MFNFLKIKKVQFISNIYPKRLFLKNEHSKMTKGLEIKEKAGISQPALCIGDPSENRTRVFAVRGRRPRPLDDGTNIHNANF